MNESLSELIEIVQCVSCGGDLKVEGEKVFCNSCEKEFLYKDGILVLLDKISW